MPLSLAVGAAVAALQVHRSLVDSISPYDEGYQLSYVQYVSQGHLPHVGDALNTWSRQAFSCHPVFPFGAVTAVPCGQTAAAGAYPEGGTNTAAGWPPMYHAFAAVVTKLLQVVGVEPLHGARVASALLWATGAALLVFVASRFGAPPAAAAAAGLLAGAIPVATTLGAFVSPHSAQLLLSVLICATVLSLMRTTGRLTGKHLTAALLVPVIAVMTVPHALVAITIAYLGLLFFWAQALMRRRGLPQLWWMTFAGPVLALAAYEGWSASSTSRATAYAAGTNAVQAQNLADPRGDSLLQPLIGQWWHFWTGSVTGDTLGFGNWELLVSQGAVILIAGALGVALLTPDPGARVRALAIGFVVGAPLTSWAFDRVFAFAVPARYGASVIGVGLLLLALTTARRPARVLLFLAVVLWASAFVSHWP